MNYYNEIDPKAAAWLRELINQGHLPAGDVDTRSITEVQPNDLLKYTQCHFFAGIGGWSLALRQAGWSDSRPVWTGSCPCQPFSSAGKGLAQKDERHLWPAFFDLIRQCRPPIVFGEQVASAAVVGHSDKNKSVQSVRDREALFRILQELKRGAAGNMQGLCEDGGASAEAEQAQDGKGRLQKMEGRETRLCSCERGEAQSQELWDTLRPLGREHSGKDRQGGLRSDRDTLRPIDSPLLERTLTGSNRTQSGIHHGEYPSGLICPECHGELLGVTEDCGSVEGYPRVEERSIEQIIGRDWEETSRTLEECWLDGISADLEAEGYACGATVLGAHSVSAPHQRQRLYWVAHSSSTRGGSLRSNHLEGDGRSTQIREAEGPDGLVQGCAPLGLANAESGRAGDDESICIRGTTAESVAHSEAVGLGDPRRPSDERRGESGDVGCSAGEEQSEARQRQRGGDADSDPVQDDHGLPIAGGERRQRGEGAEDRSEQHRQDAGREQGDDAAAVPSETSFWGDFQLVHCRDGKTRRVPTEPLLQRVANGIPLAVDHLRATVRELETQIAHYAKKTNGTTLEAVREMQHAFWSEAIQWDARGRIGILSPEILLAALCQLEGELGGIKLCSSQSIIKTQRAIMLRVQEYAAKEAAARPPPGREYAQQLAREFADSLHELSYESALEGAQSIFDRALGFPLTSGCPARTTLLRGYGNAIVPQVAAEFVSAYLETVEG